MGDERFARADKATRASLERLCGKLAELTGTETADWFPTFKARQGMRVAFGALAACGDARREVATQLFTCCTAVDPIVAAGLEPVYGDISPVTLALDATTAPVGERTACVVLQHTFGIRDAASDAALRDRVHGAGALLLEDCAHCAAHLGLDASGRPVADVSVHSFGVEKMLPTHFGGAVWVNPDMADAVLRDEIRARLAALPALDAAHARAARRYLNQIRVLNHLPHGVSHALREGLRERGLFEPAIAPVELAGGLASEPALPGSWVADQAFWALMATPADEDVRSAAARAYGEALAGLPGAPGEGAWATSCGLGAGLPLLRVGLFLANAAAADAAVARLCAAGHYSVPWYRPLLFPGVTDEAAFGLPDGMAAALDRLPVTRACSEGTVCLPTDVSPEVAREVVRLALGA